MCDGVSLLGALDRATRREYEALGGTFHGPHHQTVHLSEPALTEMLFAGSLTPTQPHTVDVLMKRS